MSKKSNKKANKKSDKSLNSCGVPFCDFPGCGEPDDTVVFDDNKAEEANKLALTLDLIKSLSDIGLSLDLYGNEDNIKAYNLIAVINRLAGGDA